MKLEQQMIMKVEQQMVMTVKYEEILTKEIMRNNQNINKMLEEKKVIPLGNRFTGVWGLMIDKDYFENVFGIEPAKFLPAIKSVRMSWINLQRNVQEHGVVAIADNRFKEPQIMRYIVSMDVFSKKIKLNLI